MLRIPLKAKLLCRARNRVLLAALLAPVVFTACMGTLPWPTPQYKDEVSRASLKKCPNIAGTYFNRANKSDPQCVGIDAAACESLTFYLLSEQVPEAKGVSNFPTSTDDWPATATYVQIRQPSNSLIQILVGRSSSQLELARELRAENDDFRCISGEIHLKPRALSDFVAMGIDFRRRLNRDDRSMKRTGNGELTISSSRIYSSYFFGFVGGTVREEEAYISWAEITAP